jgi:SAM-dependent methyltransferase
LFLVAATLGHTDCIACAKVANCVLGAAAALLLSLLSARIFRRRAVAIAAGLAAALHPGFVLLSTEVQTEPLFLLLLLGAGLFLLVAGDRPSSNAGVVAGGLLGLAALTRSSALALAPLLLAPLLDRRFPRRVGLHLAASAGLGFLVALTPWTLRNAVVFHELIPVSDAGGFSFYQGNSIWTRRYYALRNRQDYAAWNQAMDDDALRHLAEIEREGKRTPSQRSAAFARLALEDTLADPAGSLRLIGLKAWQWLRPYPTPWFWPSEVVAAVGLLYSGIYVFAAVGFARSPRRGVAAFCTALLVVSMAAHVVLQVVWRYRVPYWDPVLLLYGTFGAWRACASSGYRRATTRAAPTVWPGRTPCCSAIEPMTFVCPICRAALVREADVLRCTACDRRSPLDGGIADFSEGRYFDAFVPGQRLTDAQRQGLEFEIPGAASRVRDFYLPLLARSLGTRTGGLRLLDSGCGNGLSVDILCEAGHDAWGVDLSALRKWQWRERTRRDRLACADSLRLPFADGAFDAILCSGVLEHVGVKERGGDRYEVSPLPDRDALRLQFLAEHVRVLAPGGTLWLDFPNGAFPIDFWHGVRAGAPRWHRRDEGFLPTFEELQRYARVLGSEWRVRGRSAVGRLRFRQVGAHWWGRLLAPAADTYLAVLAAFPPLLRTAANPFLVVEMSRRPTG